MLKAVLSAKLAIAAQQGSQAQRKTFNKRKEVSAMQNDVIR